jgi:hypothetical protein
MPERVLKITVTDEDGTLLDRDELILTGDEAEQVTKLAVLPIRRGRDIPAGLELQVGDFTSDEPGTTCLAGDGTS